MSQPVGHHPVGGAPADLLSGSSDPQGINGYSQVRGLPDGPPALEEAVAGGLKLEKNESFLKS